MADADDDRSLFDRLGEMPLVRVAAYYVLLFAGGALALQFIPGLRRLLDQPDYGAVTGVSHIGGTPVTGSPQMAGGDAVLLVLLVTSCTIALMLPVAGIYVMTRTKQGYRQSMVHTLLILPVVTAGVVVVVKNSLALAFGLAGIVAAVSFRNRLEDSKDAVYIFLATAVGLACGVQAVGIATALSIVFNLLILGLWWSDFGRVPGPLQGAAAEQRLRRAISMANRTHQFVSLVDQEILRSLAPEQLQQVAGRVAAQQARAGRTPAGAGKSDDEARPMRRLRIGVNDGMPIVRMALEAVLEADTKKWTFTSATTADGQLRLDYQVRLRKKVSPDLLQDRLRAAAGPALRSLTLDPEAPA